MRILILFLVCVMLALVAFGCDRGQQASTVGQSMLTRENLAVTPDEDIEFFIVQQVMGITGESVAEERLAMADLPGGLRMVYTTWMAEAEIANGGFSEYFEDPCGPYALEALKGYELIGAKKHAAILREAMAVYVRARPNQKTFKVTPEISKLAEARKNADLSALNSLDRRFHALDKEEDISALRVKYIRKYPEECVVE